jgi:hypothetical protein
MTPDKRINDLGEVTEVETASYHFAIRGLDNEDYIIGSDLEEKRRFLCARDGDHLCTRFQCDLCHFINIQKRPPISSVEDVKLLTCIRRANLDALWSLETNTVKGVKGDFRRAKTLLKELGMEVGHVSAAMGPTPVKDCQGMAMAATLLRRTLDKGSNEPTVQFGTARKLRSLFSNLWHASNESSGTTTSVKGQTKTVASTCPTNAGWFEKFMRGLHKRMGDHSLPDRAVSIELMIEFQKRLEGELDSAIARGDTSCAEEVIMIGAFSTMGYCGGLRGEEIVLGDLGGMNDHWEEALRDKTPHIPIALLGRFKGETGEQYHYMPLALVTASGIRIEFWMSAVRTLYASKGIAQGPLFRDRLGKRVRAGYWAQAILSRFQRIQEERPDIIPPSVLVTEEYGMSRSWRRGFTSQALAQDLEEKDINRNNRWRTKENAKGKGSALTMIEHYADVRLIVRRLIRCSAAL